MRQAGRGLAVHIGGREGQAIERLPVEARAPVEQSAEVGQVVGARLEVCGKFADILQESFAAAGDRYVYVHAARHGAARQLCIGQAAGIAAFDARPVVARIQRHAQFACRQQHGAAPQGRLCRAGIIAGPRRIETGLAERRQIARNVESACQCSGFQRRGIGSAVDPRAAVRNAGIERSRQLPVAQRPRIASGKGNGIAVRLARQRIVRIEGAKDAGPVGSHQQCAVEARQAEAVGMLVSGRQRQRRAAFHQCRSPVRGCFETAGIGDEAARCGGVGIGRDARNAGGGLHDVPLRLGQQAAVVMLQIDVQTPVR